MATLTKQPQENILPDINTKYVYVLVQKSEHRGRVYDAVTNEKLPDPVFSPRRNLLLSCNIFWKGETDPFSQKPRPAGKYRLRYYDGCSTLFADNQPQEKDTIDALVSSTRQIIFLHGYVECWGYDTMLKTYLDWASWNEESPYRTPTAEAVYKCLNTESQMKAESESIDLMETALNYAKTASVKTMRTHARYLGISFEDLISGNPKSDTAIRVDYRKMASTNPKHFVDTFNDKTIQIKTWISDSLDNGSISTSIIPNKAVWRDKGAEICDISGLKSQEGILNKLIEFSQLPEGSEFVEMLNSINK